MHICISQKRKSFLQTGHKKTFMGINWCKEVHCNLNYDGVELQREEKMKPENKSAVYIMVGSIQVLIWNVLSSSPEYFNIHWREAGRLVR
jgi:hypothetical protein